MKYWMCAALLCVQAMAMAFEDKGHVYSIDFPEGWTVEEQDANQIEWVTARSPAEKETDPYLENIQITYNLKSSKITLNQYLPEMLRYMREKYAGIEIEQIGTTTIAGQEAKWVQFRAQGPGASGKQIPLKAIHYILVKDSHLMIILCVAPQNRFDDWKSTFETTLNSLKFSN